MAWVGKPTSLALHLLVSGESRNFTSAKHTDQGRSAFEPPENTHEHAPQTAIRSSEDSAGSNDAEENRYQLRNAEHARTHLYRHNGQLFDERGHPTNLTSREFSRSMRRAQNEILSVVGVCVRDISKPHDTQMSSSFEPDTGIIQRTARENMYGLMIQVAGAVMHCSITWWIDSLRQRLLVFEIPQHLGLAEIIAIQTRSLTFSNFLLGTISQFIPILLIEKGILAEEIVEAIDKNIITKSTLAFKSRARLHRMAPTFEKVLTLIIDFATFPLILQHYLVNLQLVPYTAVFPPLASFIPFSSSSPIQLMRIPINIGLLPLMGWLLSIVTNPYILLNGYRYLNGLFMDLLADQFRAEILDPSPPDCYSVLCDDVDDLFNDLKRAIKIRKRNLHTWSGKTIRRMLSLLGWSWINNKAYIDNYNIGNPNGAGERDHSMRGSVAQDYMTLTEQQDSNHLATLGSIIRELTETSESALPSFSSAEGNEISENAVVASRSEMLQRNRLGHNSSGIQLYRRTDLSEAPSAGLVPFLNESITCLFLLPVKAAVLKHIVQTFINSPLTRNVNGLSPVCMQPLPPFRGILVKPFRVMKFTNFITNLERFALASALKLVIDLGWWTCEWAAVVWAGRRFFNWGHL